MINIEVVLSPALLHLNTIRDTNVVVIDILRATSTICTAIHHGANSVKALMSQSETLEWAEKGYLTAAERNGQKIEGFDLGNSPFECMDGKVNGRSIALTTTNGTKCIEAVANDGARNVFSGSFLNLEAMANFLANDKGDVLLLCAGWKDSVNLEDTLFAGALAHELNNRTDCKIDCDAALMSMDIYQMAKVDLISYLKKSSHYKRLSHLHHEEDMVYCLKHSIFETVCGLKDGEMKKF
ncbi:MAG: 2-phosphosulfolactate phosphatase [Bacteroidia bacterium]|nr:2-phosphosulfolactate phosphatase [Bacteroidia bacterium]